MNINRHNYEDYFLLSVDRELNPADMEAVEKFLTENPDLDKEYRLLQQTILTPPILNFDFKNSLLREEKERKIISIFWLRAAAVVAFIILGAWFLKLELKNAGDVKIEQAVAQTKDKQKKTPLNPVDISSRKGENVVSVPTTPGRGLKKPGKLKEIKSAQIAVIKSSRAVPEEKNITDAAVNNSDEESGSYLAEDEISMKTKPGNTGLQLSENAQTSGREIAPVMLPAAGIALQTNSHQTVYSEQEVQNDNAISVIALNDRNKAITGFFKKLTTRNPTDENARKIRVSVFQFSY